MGISGDVSPSKNKEPSFEGRLNRMNKPKNTSKELRRSPDSLYFRAVPSDERRVEDTPISETGPPMPRGEVCVPAIERDWMDEPMKDKIVGFARAVYELGRETFTRGGAPRPAQRRLTVDEIMTGPSPMSPDAERRAEEVRRRPRRELPVKPLAVRRD
jgi:hypothetical protein